ncbi:hypothetical protein BJ878DRAFT_199912 [Calycina marina]|uniref:K Homology domain-containing protein n=1 Tax=Calycina marina TaxID=1763456 RepID=A0A9P8CJM0_9HELO|nr:hypothetical protein BJ878DRAFT_199912 [Calycina marina]
MADQQPNIQAILAALANQRPAQQATTQSQPPAYQQAPPSQQQYQYGAPSYLPQPVSSGSLDLSSIKPANSGSVSIADAIAKAKAIAAEKSVSYSGQSAGGRPYQNRSRSRSPPVRREAFRDNFNPYRDERRGDRAPVGRDYRERSFSPDPRGRAQGGTFSPARNNGGGGYGRDRSPDVGTESISIESNLVGLIIGRQGENLRRIESESGCRVQFITGPDDSGPVRQCKISGNRMQRAACKAELNRIIDESGMSAAARGGGSDRHTREAPPPARASSHQPALRDGEDTMQIMVPHATVGLIIGRGGETIRDLQERSGCHVNIVGEQKNVNGLRPVNLIGTREAAARAKDLIMEIVESDAKTTGQVKDVAPPRREQARNDQYGGVSYGVGGGGGGGGGGDKVSESIYVPTAAVGMIIGKGGETIKDMQSTTGCKINVSQPGPGGRDEPGREIGLVGSRDAVAAAKRAIEEKVDTQQRNAAQQGGGGGGRGRGPQNDCGDRSIGQPAYNPQQTQAQNSPQAGQADPYAAYGGYDAYVALWYAMAAQQQAGGGQANGDQPPGTS